MTSVMNILLSFAMTLSLLLGSASAAILNTVAESTENNSAAVAGNYADDMNFSEVIGDGTCTEASDSSVSTCDEEVAVIGEGVSEPVAINLSAPPIAE